jgi:hypothetical protein
MVMQNPMGVVVMMICCDCFTPNPVLLQMQQQAPPPINVTP